MTPHELAQLVAGLRLAIREETAAATAGLHEAQGRVLGELSKMRGDVTALREMVSLHEWRIGKLEQSTDDWAEQTGRHQIVQAKVDDLQESRKHWARYGVATAVAVALCLISAVSTVAIQGCM